MSKITADEKLFIKKISAVSKKDENIIDDLLYSILCSFTKEYYKGNKSFIIPYICKIDVETKQVLNINTKKEELKVVLTATPLQGLINEVNSIENDEITPSEKYIKRRVFDRFKKLMDINDLELDIDDK